MLDIFQIQSYRCVEQRITPRSTLPQPGHASSTNRHNCSLLGARNRARMRPRSHEADIIPENIRQLLQLFDAALPQPTPAPCYPRGSILKDGPWRSFGARRDSFSPSAEPSIGGCRKHAMVPAF